jgi:hypothetical protein
LARRGRWSLWRPGGGQLRCEREARAPWEGRATGPPSLGAGGRGLLMGGVSGRAPSMGIARGEAPSAGGGLMGPYVFASSLGGLAGGRGGHLPGATGAGAFDGEAVQTTRTPAGSPGERPPRWGG